MNLKCEISIVVPVYNAGRYLEESVSSILDQTYSNLQIILVNDGSKDDSWQICQKLAGSDPRIIAITQENRGVSVARNQGLDLATGEWIMFVDPDDILDQNIIMRLLQEQDNQTDIVATACYGFQGNEKTRAHFYNGNRVFSNDKSDLILQLLHSDYGQVGPYVSAIGVPWGKIYRRSFIEHYHLRFDPKLRRMQDNVFNIYAFSYAKKVIYLDEPLYFYRVEHLNNFNKNSASKLMESFIPVVEARYNALRKLGIYSNSNYYNFYANEALDFLAIICDKVVSEKGNLKSVAEGIINTEYYTDILERIEDNKSLTISNSLRIKAMLLKQGRYSTYSFVSRATALIKKIV